MSIYTDLGLKKIINASGKMTALGGSILDSRISDYMGEAASEFVEMEELIDKAGEIIANYIGAEDVCITIGAAAGIAISVASVVTGGNLEKIHQLPLLEDDKKNILIQKGHAINFGAPITQMVRLGGGNPIEVGQANKVDKFNIENNIDENTKALLYIKSHHCVQKGMVPLEDMVGISKKYDIPLIVDAAAEEDLEKYLNMGVDLVIYSGGKALSGPTSGFIAGRKDLIKGCKLQYSGIGRAMKLSKESIAGLLKAIEIYYNETQDKKVKGQREKMDWLKNKINKIEGLKSSIEQDEAGRQIYRLKISIDEERFGMDAKNVIKYLESGSVRIFTRNHYANVGIIYIDPRPLVEGDEIEILNKFLEISNINKKGEIK